MRTHKVREISNHIEIENKTCEIQIQFIYVEICLFVRFFSSNISSKFFYLIQCHKWRVFVVLKLRIGEDKDLACSVVSANEIV